jgi:hypothetical protein
MQYWYPTQQRVDALSLELKQLEILAKEEKGGSISILRNISEIIRSAATIADFPKHQIGRWLWVASQFRLCSIASEPDIAGPACAALIFLGKAVQTGRINPGKDQELNWVLDTTVRRLRARLPADRVRSWLSPLEVEAVESRLKALMLPTTFDADAVSERVRERLDELNGVSMDGRIAGVAVKIEALTAAAHRPGNDGAAARAALLYVAQEDDVVSDAAGILGLLDDLYVIDWAYAVVEGQTRCLPILNALLDRWPFVEDLALVSDPPMPLDFFSRYIACAGLNSLFSKDAPSLLILRESAGYAAVTAVLAAVNCACGQAEGLESEIGAFPVGQAVMVSDGRHHFKAQFAGIVRLEGKPKIRLGVRRNGSLTVPMNVAPYIARRPTAHKMLCDGSELSQWLKARHLDPLTALTGSGRRRLQRHECVLLVMPKNKLDDYFPGLRPFGMSAAALLGAKYVGADLVEHDLEHEPSDSPFIYACADPATAFALIKAPPQNVSSWRVIVDGARAGKVLRASLKASAEHADVPMCVLGELHEREAAGDLMREDMQPWYLEDHDVEPPPAGHRPVQPGDDRLTRSLLRRGAHWSTTIKVHEVRSEFLEAAAGCLNAGRAMRGDDTQIQALEFAISAFIQKATARPVGSPEVLRQLGQAASNLASHASVLSLYDQRAGHIQEVFRRWDTVMPPAVDRVRVLADLVQAMPASQSVAVICRSEEIAQACRTASRPYPRLAGAVWTNLDGLRRLAPFDRVVVAGWLDKMAMREIANNGYGAQVDLILFPFEQRWFNATRDAGKKWERRIEARTIGVLRRLTNLPGMQGVKGGLWSDEAEKRLDDTAPEVPPDVVEDNDAPEFEQVEARAITALQSRIEQARSFNPTAPACLVMFERDGAYSFLPPHGRVIVLADAKGALDSRRVQKGDAEKALFRNVAALEPGMVLAFPKGGGRDLIEEKTDQFLKDAALVRSAAGLWKAALRRHVQQDQSGYVEFSKRMAAAGERRDPYTVRAWSNYTHSIAPRNYRVLVPLIAKLTGDRALTDRMREVLAAIDQIYRARTQAAEAILAELFSGRIDVEADELVFMIGSSALTYALHKVKAVLGVQETPIPLIGKIASLSVEAASNASEETEAAK